MSGFDRSSQVLKMARLDLNAERSRKRSDSARRSSPRLIVMRELFLYLKPYRDQIVLIGGWVPYFLLEKYRYPGEYDQHVGSLDTDVALDAFSIPETAYKRGMYAGRVWKGYSADRRRRQGQAKSDISRPRFHTRL